MRKLMISTLSTLSTLGTILFVAVAAFSQTTAFTYQGSLQSGGSPANGNFDFEFKLFDALTNGTQQGGTQQRLNVAVSNGVFAVSLDFGTVSLPGADRFLDIVVRTAGGGAFTPLSPRQPVTSAPYSVKSLSSTSADTATNATQLGGVAANQYVITTDPRMTDARNPLPNSANYIWNQNSVLQPSSNFIISGNGDVGGTLAANIVRAATQFNIGGNRILSNPGLNNLFAGVSAGQANTIGDSNSFFGHSAGNANVTGSNNSIFGASANVGFPNLTFATAIGAGAVVSSSNTVMIGRAVDLVRVPGELRANRLDSDVGFYTSGQHALSLMGTNVLVGNYAGEDLTTGDRNSFLGEYAGENVTTGSDNSFFGYSAGVANNLGFGNTFIGSRAGSSGGNTTYSTFVGESSGIAASGSRNTFVGSQSGTVTTSGDRNAFFGNNTGSTNTLGANNTIIGSDADVLGNTLRNATAVGYRAAVGADQSLVLGSIAGINGCGDFGSFCDSVNVGIGTTTPLARLHIVGGADAGLAGAGYLVTGDVAALNVVIDNNEIMARNNGAISQLLLNADGGNVGIGTTSAQDTLHVDGIIRVATLGAAGATNVCRNVNNQLSTCSSSLRYKTNVDPFGPGLSFVNQLRPISFDWKDGGVKDVGFGAEDVAKIDPRFVTHNEKGEIEGVKYDRLSVVFVNALKEQQAEIETQRSLITSQQKQNDELKKQVEELKAAVCSIKADARFCNPKEK